MTKHSYDKEFKEQAVQYYLDNKDHMTMNEISKNRKHTITIRDDN